MDIPIYIEQQNEGVHLLVCDAFLANTLREKPKHLDIIDKFDVSNGYFINRLKSEINNCFIGIYNTSKTI